MFKSIRMYHLLLLKIKNNEKNVKRVLRTLVE